MENAKKFKLFFTWQLRSGLPSQQCQAVCTPRFVFVHVKDGKDQQNLEQMFVALEASSSAINACIYNIPRRSTSYFCYKLITTLIIVKRIETITAIRKTPTW